MKILATGQTESWRFPSGPTLMLQQMVSGVKEHVAIGSTTWCRSATQGWCSGGGNNFSENRADQRRWGALEC